MFPVSSKRLHRFGLTLTVMGLVCLPPGMALAQVQADLRADSGEDRARQIASLDLDDLLDMKVTLATRTPEPWFNSASAMYVINSEDIRRSGMLHVPELLRMAPGVHVARMDANKWKIAIRGFNERFSNKLLVLIDGRIVYSPLFSGVYWDVQNLAVEDIDRIEIVRGPGAALWGSNAVNGIINILTRGVADTQGGLMSATGGAGATAGQLYGRYGFGGEKFKMRVYGKWDEHDAQLFPADGVPDLGGSYVPGAEAQDGWEQWQVGFNADWQVGEQDRLTFFGNYNDGEFGQTRIDSLGLADADTVLAKGGYSGLVWQRDISATSDLVLHLFQDHTERGDAGLWERRDTWTVDFQHRFGLHLGVDQEIIWGGEFRTTTDETRRRSDFYFDPDSRTLQRTSFFVQDKIPLGAARDWILTVGSKFEDNTITGFEYQPSGRLAWSPTEATTGWAAVSRAVRTPSRADSDHVVEIGGMIVSQGNPDLDSERVTTYELGARHAVSRRFFCDLAGFYNDYSKLHGGGGNAGSAVLVGAEVAARLQATSTWNLAGTYSWISVQERQDSNQPVHPPRHMLGLRSYLDLPADLEADASLFYVDESWEDTPAYTRLDLRLGWVPAKGFELSFGVLNVLDDSHRETRGGISRVATDVPRSAHVTARLRM